MEATSRTTSLRTPLATPERKTAKRLVAISVGTALSLMTVALLAVGLLAVQYLAGGSPPPRLELPGPVAAPEAIPAVDSSESPHMPEEATPQILRPQEEPSSLLGAGSLGQEAGPLELFPLTDPVWTPPAPGEMRTAKPDLGPRYR